MTPALTAALDWIEAHAGYFAAHGMTVPDVAAARAELRAMATHPTNTQAEATEGRARQGGR